jgi:hypothetical protein
MKIEKTSGFSAKWDAKLHPILLFWAKYWGFSIDFDLTIHQLYEYISLIFNTICEYILCRGIATAMQEEKRREKKEDGNNFVFFSDEKKQNWLRHVTEWFEFSSSV